MASATRSDFLDCFWGIASLHDKERTKSIQKLVSTLHRLKGENGEFNYCVQRLVKGAASNRKCARQGFSVALTEIIRTFKEVSPSVVLTAIDEHLIPSGTLKGQEERGCLFGQLFVLLSLTKSSRLAWKDCKEVILRLLSLWRKKSYLKEVSSVAIGDLLEQYAGIVVLEDVLGLLSPVLSVEWGMVTCESLYLLISLERLFPQNRLLCQHLKTHLGHKKIFCRANVKAISSILQASSDCHPRVHSIWPVILNSVRTSVDVFESFWLLTVEEGLVVTSEKKGYLTFALVESLLPTLKASEVSVVMSPNVLKCLINSLSNSRSDLHQAAHHMVDKLSTVLPQRTDEAVKVAMVMTLQGYQGVTHFDNVSKTKVVHTLIHSLSSVGIMDYLSQLSAIFLCPNDSSESNAISSQRERVLQHIVSFVKSPFLDNVDNSVTSCLEWVPNTAQIFPLSPSVEKAATQLLYAVLAHLITGERSSGTWQDGSSPLLLTVQFANTLSTSHHLCLSNVVSRDLWSNTMSLLDKLSSADGTSVKKGLCLLVAYYALALLTRKTAQATDVLKEIEVLYEETQSEASHQWIEVLTDIILVMMSDECGLSRKVASQVFRMTMLHQTQRSLALLIKILDPDMTEELKQFVTVELNRDQEDHSGSDEDDISVQDDGDDISVQDDEDDISVQDDEDDISVQDDKDDISVQDEEMSVDEEFRLKIKSALGRAAHSDNDTESTSDLDDEEMLKLDTALAEAFRSRSKNYSLQKQKKEYQKQLVHFRLRVLELTEAFVKRHKTSALLLELLGPLVRLSCCNMSELRAKATGIVVKLTRGKVPKVGVSEDVAKALLEDLVSMVKRVSTDRLSVVTDSALWLVRVLRGLGAKDGEWTWIDPFKNSVLEFYSMRSASGYYGLLLALTQRFPEIGWALYGDLVEGCVTAQYTFRKTQCYQLLNSLLRGQMNKDCTDEINRSLYQILDEFKKLSALITSERSANKAQRKLLKEMMLLFTSLLDAAMISDTHWDIGYILSDLLLLPSIQKDKGLVSACNQMSLTLDSCQGPPKSKKKK